MKLISISLLCCMMLMGCAKPQTVYITEYQEVEVPVVYKLQRPKRPVYLPTDTAPVYLLKVLEYTEALEVIIDEHNKKD